MLEDKISPKKYSLLLFKYSSSKIVTDVPTVDKDCGLLFGAMTILVFHCYEKKN